MKMNSLTTAVVAGIAGVAGFAGLANAVHLNPEGLGHVLLCPYYAIDEARLAADAGDWVVTFPTKHFHVDPPTPSAHRVEMADFRID